MVSGLLAGTGLEIRERDKHLVISNPRHPERGRIYVTYTAGEISLRQTTWQYWGYLDGYGKPQWADPESEPAITAGKIIKVLSGQPDSPL